jgi:hypothetical protein
MRTQEKWELEAQIVFFKGYYVLRSVDGGRAWNVRVACGAADEPGAHDSTDDARQAS